MVRLCPNANIIASGDDAGQGPASAESRLQKALVTANNEEFRNQTGMTKGGIFDEKWEPKAPFSFYNNISTLFPLSSYIPYFNPSLLS